VSARQFADLQGLGVRTIKTAQAATAWRVSVSAASKMLRELASAGLIESLRHGLWLLDRDATAESLATEITAPYPSYVSHVSALYMYGVIDQVPTDVHVVSAAEPRRIESSRGAYRLHRMPTDLFGGYTNVRGVNLATVEKSLFDWAYLSVASGRADARLPETEWPSSFRRAEVDSWVRRIADPRLRTMTKSLVDRRLASS
jgi:predicted transcriptional regulator of viral defense system